VKLHVVSFGRGTAYELAEKLIRQEDAEEHEIRVAQRGKPQCY